MEEKNEIDWNLCSNQDLINERERLEKEYKENQEICKRAYDKIMECTLNYSKIKEILEKRNVH